jgi:hypothetical protein
MWGMGKARVQERNKRMLKFIVAALVIGLGVYVIRQQLPDIQRYLSIRAM